MSIFRPLLSEFRLCMINLGAQRWEVAVAQSICRMRQELALREEEEEEEEATGTRHCHQRGIRCPRMRFNFRGPKPEILFGTSRKDSQCQNLGMETEQVSKIGIVP